MKAASFLVALAAGICCAAPGWQSTMSSLRKSWNLAPADAARRGLWECRKLSKGPDHLLLRADSAKDGSVRSLEWSFESGVRATDIPDETFWAVLDGVSQDAEWTEADPDGLPKSFLRSMDVPASQGFLCRSCKPRLAAATFNRHGATGLRIAPLSESVPSFSVGLVAGITEDGIRSLAAQRKLEVNVANPCLDKSGVCSLELGGPLGQKWTFSRTEGTAPWSSLEASYQAGAWWSPEWDWDSLRIQAPHEFKTVVGAWIGSQADLFADNLLSPVEPVLAFPVSSWKSRDLPGLRIQQASDSIAKLPSPPSSLVFARSERLKAQIDGFGRRSLKLGDAAR